MAVVERLKAEQALAADDNQRLSRELDAMRARLADGESLSSELASLKQERDVIRARVGEMLDQLDALNL